MMNEAKRESDLAAAGLAGLRALVVDDSDINRAVIKGLLSLVSMESSDAANGAQAVGAVASVPDGYYDVVLMDIQMPVMNGYDAALAIRSMDRDYCRRLPIIATTSNSFEEYSKMAPISGMNGFVPKPIDACVLLETVARLCGK